MATPEIEIQINADDNTKAAFDKLLQRVKELEKEIKSINASSRQGAKSAAAAAREELERIRQTGRVRTEELKKQTQDQRSLGQVRAAMHRRATARINQEGQLKREALKSEKRLELELEKERIAIDKDRRKREERLEIQAEKRRREELVHQQVLRRERERTHQARIRAAAQQLGRRDFIGLAGAAADASLAIEGVGFAIAAAGASIIRHSSDFERLNKALVAVTGSASLAHSQLQDIRRIARLPGITFTQASQAALRLRASGFDQGITTRLLTEFSNAASKSGAAAEDVSESLRQLTQIRATGRFTSENLNIILERIPILRPAFLSAFGTTVGGDVQKAIEKAGLTFEAAIEKLVGELEKTSRAAGDTFHNAMSNLENAFGDLQRELGGKLTPTLTELVKATTSVVEFFSGPVGSAIINAASTFALVYGGGKAVQGLSSLLGGAGAGAAAGGIARGLGATAGLRGAVSFSSLSATISWAAITAGTIALGAELGRQYDPLGRLIGDDRSVRTDERIAAENRRELARVEDRRDLSGIEEFLRVRNKSNELLTQILIAPSPSEIASRNKDIKNLSDHYKAVAAAASDALERIKEFRRLNAQLVSDRENQIAKLRAREQTLLSDRNQNARRRADLLAETLTEEGHKQLDVLADRRDEIEEELKYVREMIRENQRLLGISKDRLENESKILGNREKQLSITKEIGNAQLRDLSPSDEDRQRFGRRGGGPGLEEDPNRPGEFRERRRRIQNRPDYTRPDTPGPRVELDIRNVDVSRQIRQRNLTIDDISRGESLAPSIRMERPQLPAVVGDVELLSPDRITEVRRELQAVRSQYESLRDTLTQISNIKTLQPLEDADLAGLKRIQESLNRIGVRLLGIRKEYNEAGDRQKEFGVSLEELNVFIDSVYKALGLLNTRLGQYSDAADRANRKTKEFGEGGRMQRPRYLKKITDDYVSDFYAELERRQVEEAQLRQRIPNFVAGVGQSFYQDFGADFILEAVGIGGRSQDRVRDALDKLKMDFRDVQAEIIADSTVSEKQRFEELKRLNEQYIKDKRSIEKQAEDDRARAWRDWTKNVIVDFGRIIYEQLRLRVAVKATNAVLNSIGLSSFTTPAAGGIGAGQAAGVGAAAAGAGGIGTAATIGVGAAIAATAIYGLIDPVKDLFGASSFHNAVNDQYAFQKAADAGRKMFGGQTPEQYGRQSTKDLVDNMSAGLASSSGGGGGGPTYLVANLQIGNREIQEVFEVGNDLDQTNRLVSPGGSSVARNVESRRIETIESNVGNIQGDVSSAVRSASQAKTAADNAQSSVDSLKEEVSKFLPINGGR